MQNGNTNKIWELLDTVPDPEIPVISVSIKLLYFFFSRSSFTTYTQHHNPNKRQEKEEVMQNL